MNCNGFRFLGTPTVGTADATRLKMAGGANSVPAIRGLGRHHNKRQGYIPLHCLPVTKSLYYLPEFRDNKAK